MEKAIYLKPLLDDLKGIKETLVGAGDPILASVLNRAIACVEKQPVADAVPAVHGRWVFLNDYQSECSECHKVYWVDHASEPNYCPNCGAKMDGGKDNEQQK